MLRESLAFIQSRFLGERVIKHPGRAEAERFYNYPFEALEEALANAVYHRGYDEREPIEVRISAEEIVIVNYPGPDRSVRLDQLRKGKAVSRRYRNRRIGDFLKELEITEGRSTGIPKILRVMKTNGSPPPEFEFDDDHSYFIVRLPVHPKEKARSESRSESNGWDPLWHKDSVHYRVISSIKEASLSRSSIASAIGHKSVTGALRQAIQDLMIADFIIYTIPDKPNSRLQKYRLTEKGHARKEAQ